MNSSPKKRDPADEVAERAMMAQRLRDTREYLGFSQKAAQYLGISRSALSNIETGQRRVEAVELKRLAELYKKPLAYFTGEPAPAAEPLPLDIEHLARKASTLTAKDRDELSRFADFLRARAKAESPDTTKGEE